MIPAQVWCLLLLWDTQLGPEPLMDFSGSWWRMAGNPLGHGPEFCLLVPSVFCLEVNNCQCALSLPWLVWLPGKMVCLGSSAQGLSLPATEGMMVLEVSSFQTTHFHTCRVKASGQSSGQVREVLCSQAFLWQQCWSLAWSWTWGS